MKSGANLYIKGPWAEFERRHKEDTERVIGLQAKVELLQKELQFQTSTVADLQTRLEGSESSLRQESQRNKTLSSALQNLQTSHADYRIVTKSRLEAVETELAAEREDAQEQQLQLSREVDRLELENQALKDEVESVMHHRRTASLGLESAMQALNLSREGAADFLKELSSVKQKIEDLTVKNAQLRMDKRVLEQQRESHAEHAQVLLKENSRLLDQLHMAAKRGVLAPPVVGRSVQKQKASVAGGPEGGKADGACSKIEHSSLPRKDGKENLWRR